METEIKVEQSKLLFAFYKKVVFAKIPLGAVLCYLSLGSIDTSILLAWLLVLLLSCIGQILFVTAIESKKFETDHDYLKWTKVLNIIVVGSGCFFASATIATIYLPPHLYFIACYFLVVSITVVSCSGFKDTYLAFATPVLIGLAVSGFIYFETYWYLTSLISVVIALFIALSKYFENTLLESIRIRFENQQLINELKFKRAEAEHANRAKSVFLASASHDLRQPLHALNFQLASIETELETDAHLIPTVKMKRSLSALNDLFEGILDISKIDSGMTEPRLEDFYISECCSRLQDEFQHQAESKGLKLCFKVETVVVNSDLLLLERVLANLISNAIRYTNTGEVKVEGVIEGELFKLHISDTGQGIPNDELENIFDEFYQLEKPKETNIKGFGLGLFIVKRLCQLLKHDLVVESQAGLGSVFTLTLPLGDSAKAGNGQTNVEPRVDLNGLTVILIDDDVDVLDATKELLNKWGCSVSTAQTASEAMAHIERGVYPDIILSDHSLAGEVSGIDVIEKIRLECSLNIPSLLLTGDTSAKTLSCATRKGYIILHKPVNPLLLRETIYKIVNTTDFA